ncbi:MAG: outer membrane lipoprotein carrier protein LolA [Alicyclobacillus sp.]|nr:outer membrane lipoprotein carrier protein LolA [Alicyclobacillus sp.]
MRKAAGFILAAGLAVGLVAGCGAPSKQNVVSQLQTQAEELDATNYQSTAIMTVQMDSGSQKYYVETSFDSPTTYKIALGDANKHINQIIVRNENGMFIVSPSLQKVFRFNGNWAQNQGHIYLYDQILEQIVKTPDLKMGRAGQETTFTMPITPKNDVVATQKVSLMPTSNGYQPKQIVLLDSKDKAVVTIDFTSYKQGVKFSNGDFDPQKLATSEGNAAKTTMASDNALTYIEPQQTFGAKIDVLEPDASAGSTLLHYTGPYGFTLDESRPAPGVSGLPSAELVDLYGVPGILSGDDQTRQLTWFNDGIEFSLTSSQLSLDQMESVAISTIGQTGK